MYTALFLSKVAQKIAGSVYLDITERSELSSLAGELL